MKRLSNKLNTNRFVATILFIGVIISCTAMRVEASSFSVSGPSSVTANETFTVNFGSGTTGVYTYSVSGGTIVSSPSWVEGGGSLTVKAGSSGNVSVTVTASNVTTSNYEDLASGTSKSVSVAVKSADTTPTTTTTTTQTTRTEPVVVKSSVNTLSKLSVDGGELSPEFSESVTEYEVEVLDLEKIKVSATAKDSKANVTGTGEIELSLGENEVEVKVTAENGNVKTYTIMVRLQLSPTVFIEFQNQKLGVVQDISSVKGLTSFDKCVTEYQGDTIDGWYSSVLDMTILYMVDEEENYNFYVYKDEEIVSLIRKVKLGGTNYFVLQNDEDKEELVGMKLCELEIDEIVYDAWGFEEELFADYYILELMSIEGEVNYYLYSSVEEVLMINPGFAPVSDEDYMKMIDESEEEINKANSENAKLASKNKILMTIIGILIVIMIFVPIITLIVSKRKKKNSADSLEDFEILDLE